MDIFHSFEELQQRLEQNKKLEEKYGQKASAAAQEYHGETNRLETEASDLADGYRAHHGDKAWEQFANSLKQIGVQDLQPFDIFNLRVTETGEIIFPKGEGIPKTHVDTQARHLQPAIPATPMGPENERLGNIRFLNQYGPKWFAGKLEAGKVLGQERYLIAVLSGIDPTTHEAITIAIAESPDRRNASYVWVSNKSEEWKEIFTQTKQAAHAQGAQKFIHTPTGTWQNRVKDLLDHYGVVGGVTQPTQTMG